MDNRHIIDDDVIEAAENRQPTHKKDLQLARQLLQECSGDTGDNVYDHITSIIQRIVEDRQPQVIDYFEELSRQVKDDRFRFNENLLQETFLEPDRLEVAKKRLDDFKILNEIDQEEEIVEEEHISEQPYAQKQKIVRKFRENFLVLQSFWAMGGVCVARDLRLALYTTLRQMEEFSGIKCRYWGKIYGTNSNYFIIETELTDERFMEQLRKLVKTKRRADRKKPKILPEEIPDELLPVAIFFEKKIPPGFVAPVEIPDEDSNFEDGESDSQQGEGEEEEEEDPLVLEWLETYRPFNSHTYYVCADPGVDEFIELPLLSPEQLTISRFIKKYFKGDLEADISSYPTFPGVEGNLLRAVILDINHYFLNIDKSKTKEWASVNFFPSLTLPILIKKSYKYPGAYALEIESKLRDVVYYGWGYPFVIRNFQLADLPKVEDRRLWELEKVHGKGATEMHWIAYKVVEKKKRLEIELESHKDTVSIEEEHIEEQVEPVPVVVEPIKEEKKQKQAPVKVTKQKK